MGGLEPAHDGFEVARCGCVPRVMCEELKWEVKDGNADLGRTFESLNRRGKCGSEKGRNGMYRL